MPPEPQAACHEPVHCTSMRVLRPRKAKKGQERKDKGMRGPILAAFAATLLLAGCGGSGSAPATAPEATSCAYPGARPMLAAELAFGRNIKGGPGVSDADWTQFQHETLTRQFPDGMTVIDAIGQWTDPHAKQPVSEASKFVIIVAPDTQATLQSLRIVTDAYKRRFGQESVMVATNLRCVSF